jgi:predicted RNase H-like nuclease
MFFDTSFVGIDASGGRKPFTYAALDASGRLTALADGELDDVLSFLAAHEKVLVAINAPPRPSRGLVRDTHPALEPIHKAGRAAEMRLAEYELRQRGINVSATPSKREMSSGWVQVGFELYRRMEALGFLPDSAPDAKRRWLETHPQACFAVLAGQIPLPKPTLEGRLQRQLLLYQQGLFIRDPMDFFEELTRHKLLKGNLPLEQVYSAEALDALAAAYVAYSCAKHPADMLRVGDPDEGQIILPVRELKGKY